MTAHQLEEQLYTGTCEHEAGHAAAALLCHLRVKGVTATRTKASELEQAPSDMDRPVGQTVIQPDGRGEVEDRAMATMVLAGRMVETDDDGSSWPPSFSDLMNPNGWRSGDHRQLAGYVKALGLGERDYQRMVGEALRLACSDEFTRLHRALDHALRENDGVLGEEDIARIRAKTRQPKPPPPEDAERDDDGVISDEQANADIDQLRAARHIGSNGDGPSPAETKKDAFALGVQAFESGRVEVASFTC